MISNIQILRAISALTVVIFHTVVSGKSYQFGTDFFYKIDLWGPASVDIFFVISGFIMFYIQAKKRRTPVEFLKDRIERVVPLYWILTIAMSLLLLLSSQSLTAEAFIQSMLFYHYTLFQQMPVLYVGWTLEYEMLFYVLFGLTLFIRQLHLSFLLCTVALFGLVAAGLNTIVLDFLLGMIAALIFTKFKIKLHNITCLFLIALGILLITVEWPVTLPRTIYAGIPALMIFMGFLYHSAIQSKTFNLLGDASYSIYLVQVISIPLSYKSFLQLPVLPFSFTAELYVVLSVVMTCLLGIMVHLFLEKPLARGIKQLKTRRQAKTAETA